ncbi:MAG: UvrD-helicase domain-containing protein, partial [Clostridia bacterium]|nr:UvrD-helicase domain-containing protein [Clostridia bacterium]
MKLTSQQQDAISSRGKVIVSASAGSGKTFVMIEKLVGAISGGADLDEVLAVTFTKKAAAQMKEKLRRALIDKLDGAGEAKDAIKVQLSKISTADISTIHSFCARLLRKYFYVLGINSDFDIISADDGEAQDMKRRALDSVFDKNYEEGGEDFRLLLKCFMKKRNDSSLRRLICEAHSAVRSVARYESLLKDSENLYTDEGFKSVCAAYSAHLSPDFYMLKEAVKKFRAEFPVTAKKATYDKIFDEMENALRAAAAGGIFSAKLALTATRKPTDAPEDKEAGAEFKKFKDSVTKRYNTLCGDFEDEQTEKERFIQSGKVAVAFSRLLLQFDSEYAAVKADENKLDYNDLEHLVLRLLEDDAVRAEINGAYKYVFVDEYQDVNPVQEEIISALSGETFLVGDVKQAIYGFRGSKSVFFSKKYAAFENDEGTALKLSSNFRSADGVLDFVNALFSQIMRQDNCGVDYFKTAQMSFGGLYPEGYGEARLRIFGKDEEEERELGVYSVAADGRNSPYTREGLAVLEIVKEELQKQHFDLKSGKFVDTLPGDICILTRKNKGESAEGIIRALTDKGGYSVSGAQDSNVCALPEVKQMLDILSLIDNAEHDVPLVTALLSPLGGFTEDELAQIRI